MVNATTHAALFSNTVRPLQEAPVGDEDYERLLIAVHGVAPAVYNCCRSANIRRRGLSRQY